MEARGLLYLDDPWTSLSEVQVIAIARAASEIGEPGCYLSYVARYGGPDPPTQDLELKRLSADGYRDFSTVQP
jgi:hypothetical protein